MFQSLFYWMVLWKWNAHCPGAVFIYVSILILLDGTLEVWIYLVLSMSLNCFNPYFIGWYSGRLKSLFQHFQYYKFQSLFYWMVLWKKKCWKNGTTKNSVSILILLDGTLEEQNERNTKAENRAFQSLFYWMVLWKSGFNMIYCVVLRVSILILLDGTLEATLIGLFWFEKLCFNPYFIGWYSGSCWQRCCLNRGVLFQSLFYWMVLWKTNITCIRWTWRWVSILILLDGTLEGISPDFILFKTFCFNPYFIGWYSGSLTVVNVKSPQPGFNPYFIGWYSGRGFTTVNSFWITLVSILILLDGTLEVPYNVSIKNAL